MSQLESEKFDHMERLKRQKYEVRVVSFTSSAHMIFIHISNVNILNVL